MSRSKSVLLIISILLALGLFACSGAHNSDDPAGQRCFLEMEISSEENLLFSKYDIVIYFDNNLVGSIENGKIFYGMVETNKGSHKIEFIKKTDQEVKSSTEIKVTKDETFTCTLHSSMKQIEIKNKKHEAGLKGNVIILPDLRNKLLNEAVDVLKETGFENISYHAEGETISTVSSDWTVISMNRASGSMVVKTDVIILTCISNREEVVSSGPESQENIDKPSDISSEIESSGEETDEELSSKAEDSSSDIEETEITLITEETMTEDTVTEETIIEDSQGEETTAETTIPEETTAEPTPPEETTNAEDVLLPFIPYERFNATQNFLIYMTHPNTFNIDEIASQAGKQHLYVSVVTPRDDDEGIVIESIREVTISGNGSRIKAEYSANSKKEFHPTRITYRSNSEKNFVISLYYTSTDSLIPHNEDGYSIVIRDDTHPAVGEWTHYSTVEEALDAYIQTYE